MKFIIQGRIPSKKNSKRIIMHGSRPAIISSKDYMAWHTVASYQVKLQMPTQLILRGPHSVDIVIWAPNKIRGDLTNKSESLMDLLVDCGIIADDNWEQVPEITMRFGGVDRVDPRGEIEINQIKLKK